MMTSISRTCGAASSCNPETVSIIDPRSNFLPIFLPSPPIFLHKLLIIYAGGASGAVDVKRLTLEGALVHSVRAPDGQSIDIAGFTAGGAGKIH